MMTSTFHAMVLKTGSINVRLKIQATLSYDPDIDPLAIQMVFSSVGEPDVVWHVARELMVEGMQTEKPAGIGDVKFRKVLGSTGTPNHLLACLRNNGGHADLALPYGEVSDFLVGTIEAVAIGEEVTDSHVDELIAEIEEWEDK